MLLRLMFILILASSLSAGELTDNWDSGKGESYEYQIFSYQPSEVENRSLLSINRSKSDPDVFDIFQEVKVLRQNVSFISMERYQADNLELVSSLNLILNFNQEADGSLLTDTIKIDAKAENGYLNVTCSKPDITPQKVKTDSLLTSIGTFFKMRDHDFKIGESRKYYSLNFLVIYGNQPLTPYQVVDSVIGIEKVTTLAGDFECYKVKNSVAGSYGYTYYAKDHMNLPVLVELFNPGDDKLIQKIALKSIKKKR